MIFYFSGTGNSYHAAKTIAEAQGEKLFSISEELDKNEALLEYVLQPGELLGFIYPVHAWGPPKLVLEFIKRMKLSGEKPYIFSLCTCGDEEGLTTKVFQKALNKRGIRLDSGLSIIMPNNYIFGFDVDSKKVEIEKLQKAEQWLSEINHILAERRADVFQLLPGKAPNFKTTIINPLFNRYNTNTKKFFATDNCTGCGLCEEVCPVHIIKVQGKPAWEKGCTQCLACIHRCPEKAIQYGKGTMKKGRYVHPDLLEV